LREQTTITVDNDLREFIKEVGSLLDSGADDAIAAGDDAVQGNNISCGWESEGILKFRRTRGGHRWSFRLTVEHVGMVARGELLEIPVTDLGAVAMGEEAVTEVALGRLMSALGLGGPAQSGATDSSPPPPDGDTLMMAGDFLGLMVEREMLELVTGASPRDLAAGAAPFLEEAAGTAEARAVQLSAWLVEQRQVEDLYATDEEIERLLEAW